jgi:hypothetical protein
MKRFANRILLLVVLPLLAACGNDSPTAPQPYTETGFPASGTWRAETQDFLLTLSLTETVGRDAFDPTGWSIVLAGTGTLTDRRTNASAAVTAAGTRTRDTANRAVVLTLDLARTQPQSGASTTRLGRFRGTLSSAQSAAGRIGTEATQAGPADGTFGGGLDVTLQRQ